MMPHKVDCPASVEEFDELTALYVHSAADLRELISRILVWSSVHLPGKEGAANRGKRTRLFKGFETLLNPLSEVMNGEILSYFGCQLVRLRTHC